jgi:hypothetical protein
LPVNVLQFPSIFSSIPALPFIQPSIHFILPSGQLFVIRGLDGQVAIPTTLRNGRPGNRSSICCVCYINVLQFRMTLLLPYFGWKSLLSKYGGRKLLRRIGSCTPDHTLSYAKSKVYVSSVFRQNSCHYSVSSFYCWYT